MDLETLFTVANAVAVMGWLPLVFAPRWTWTRAGVTVAVSFLLALAYIVLFAVYWGDAEGGFGSLADVMRLFDSPHAVLVGWIHYLAFDLFIGTWMAADWSSTGRPHPFVVPVLVLTFLAGPAGLAVYLVVRTVVRRDASVRLAPSPPPTGQ